MQWMEKLLRGALTVEKTADGIIPRRFTDDVAWRGVLNPHSAGIRLEAVTDATEIKMSVRLGRSQHPLARGTFDLFVDGRFFRAFTPEEPYTAGQFFHFETDLPPAEAKKLVLYFPTYRETEILDLAANDELRKMPEYEGKILFLGDSITHGYGATPGFNYAAQYARKLRKDFVNLAIGGACFPDILPPGLLRLGCDELIVAYGTNDAKGKDPLTDTERRLRNLLNFAMRNPWKITVLSPVFDRSATTEIVKIRLGITGVIKKVISEFPSVRFVDGCDAFVDIPVFFVDGTHPSPEGMTRIAELLSFS